MHETILSRIVEQMFVYIGHVSIFEATQKGGGVISTEFSISPQNQENLNTKGENKWLKLKTVKQ